MIVLIIENSLKLKLSGELMGIVGKYRVVVLDWKKSDNVKPNNTKFNA